MTRLRFLIGLALVTLGAGLFAVAFRASLAAVFRTVYGSDNVVDAIRALPTWMRVIVPAVAATVAGTIAYFRSAHVQNVSNVMEAIALGHVQLSLRSTASRVASSWVAIAGGLSIGREGPMIEMGGSLGAAVAGIVKTTLNQTRVLVAAGTAAGFASAYNTPFAATLFVLETIAGIAAPQLLLPVMAATVGAVSMTRATVGAGPIYGQRAFGIDSSVELLAFGALGLAAAAVAVVFRGVLSSLENWFEAHPVPQPMRAALGGLLVGGIVAALPEVAGNGYEPLNQILNSEIAIGAIVVLLVTKVIATSGSVASGIPGGVFTPMLLVGGCVGAAWFDLVSLVIGRSSDAGSYALVGMAAATAASIHAPLTAAVMVFELSGDYLIVLPLILATVVATATSKALGGESVYDAELRKRGIGWELTLEGRQLKEP